MAESPHGRFVWYEMLTIDKDASIDFYKQIVGWGTQDWEDGEKPYTMFTIGDAPVAGIMDLPEEARAAGAPPHWLAYVSTPDHGCHRRAGQGARRSRLYGADERP